MTVFFRTSIKYLEINFYKTSCICFLYSLFVVLILSNAFPKTVRCIVFPKLMHFQLTLISEDFGTLITIVSNAPVVDINMFF